MIDIYDFNNSNLFKLTREKACATQP